MGLLYSDFRSGCLGILMVVGISGVHRVQCVSCLLQVRSCKRESSLVLVEVSLVVTVILEDALAASILNGNSSRRGAALILISHCS